MGAGLGFPDIQTLEPLAQALGISVLELMRSKKKEFTGDVDITETQYTRQEVAEMLQNADDISKQQKKQDKNANIIDRNSGDRCGGSGRGLRRLPMSRRTCAWRTGSNCVCVFVVFFPEYR